MLNPGYLDAYPARRPVTETATREHRLTSLTALGRRFLPALLVAGLLAPQPGCTAQAGPASQDLLIFTRTLGWRHDAIPAAIAAVSALAAELGLNAIATEDSEAFTPDRLRRCKAVVFLLTTGDVLDGAQQDALTGYIRAGGGFVGVHSAADTEHDWPWFGDLVGARFHSHPWIQRATVRVVDRAHPATEHLPADWVRTDEWYNFKAAPAGVRVLAELDERTYIGGRHGDHHPVAWAHDHEGGRAFYTALGHTKESYAEPAFLDHLRGGLRDAAGL